ncbi:MAG: hypothetical protein CL910_00280 [Deltaproteobacteria bacterium]|jgi:hypothetical protein|nr:hypothetical protein [Deltaproteobacteria bacterium]
MAAALDEFGTGWQKWNPQAWVDFVTIKLMMTKVGDVIPKTYVPILRLVSEDAGKVDDGYRQVVSLREPIRLFDSPRDKWRKIYGSYIRELEWVYGELRGHFGHDEYQELVVDIMSRAIRDAMSSLLPSVEKMTRPAGAAPTAPATASEGPSRRGRAVEKVGAFLLNHLSPINAIVGPVDMKVIPGGIQMYIPRCWMHTAVGDGRTQDLACLEGCKGSCEAVFNGNTPIAMLFEPDLPEFSCTLTVKMGEGLAS